MSSPPQRPSVTAEDSLGGDRALALLHLPQPLRPAFVALFELDAALGDVVARASDPTLARIKLAWWRERLEALDISPPPAEPRLRAVAEQLLPRGISGERLSGLEPGWSTLLDEHVDPDLVGGRGALLFAVGADLLGARSAGMEDAGALHALVSVARRGLPDLFAAARRPAECLAAVRFPASVRGLTGLARLAARDLGRGAEAVEPEGSAGRALDYLRHRWSGRINVPRLT